MAFSLTEYQNSPDYIPGSFDNCLVCNYFTSWRCAGPNIANMETKRRTVFCKAVRAVRGFTNAYIAEQGEVSLITVDRFFQGVDLNMNSFTHISRVLFGVSNDNPCALTIEDGTKAMLDELEKTKNDYDLLKSTLDDIHSSYKDEIHDIRKSYEKELEEVRADLKESIVRQQKVIDKLLGE